MAGGPEKVSLASLPSTDKALIGKVDIRANQMDLTGRRGVAQDRQLSGGVGMGGKSAPSKRPGF
jgi:hypothetical protein